MATARETRAAWHNPPLDIQQQIEIPVAAVSTSTATANNETLGAFAQAVTITSVLFIPNTAESGVDTNSRNIVVRNVGDDAAGTSDVASYSQVAGNDLAAHVLQALTLDGDEAAIAAGDVLVYRSVEVGTGVATPAGTFVIRYTVDDDFEI